MNTGDTAFMLIATAMVMLMTPGLALFYGGMVRSKNVLSTLLQSFICLGVVTILWVLFGYSMAFGTDVGGLIGGLDYLLLRGVGAAPAEGGTIPHLLFCAFQLMFAVITPALITGAFAERIKFSAFLLFTILLTTLVYFPVCHWVWGGGWISGHGGLDFAGGTVIHINSGAAALVAALLIGRRNSWGREAIHPHNLGMTLLGAASGAIAGLVAITPGAGFVSPVAAISIGLVAGVLCYYAVLAKNRLGYDDALDVVGIHGVGGLWGALATGLFASLAVNPGGADGLFFGNAGLLLTQAVDAGATILYSVAVSFIILKGIDLVIGLRVTADDEVQGLDLSQHSEIGYTL